MKIIDYFLTLLCIIWENVCPCTLLPLWVSGEKNLVSVWQKSLGRLICPVSTTMVNQTGSITRKCGTSHASRRNTSATFSADGAAEITKKLRQHDSKERGLSFKSLQFWHDYATVDNHATLLISVSFIYNTSVYWSEECGIFTVPL